MAQLSARLAVEVLQQGEGLTPDGTTGATPTLRAASLASDVPPWALTTLPTPGRDKKMPSNDASDPSPKLTKVSVGDVGKSRAASLDVDETARMRDDALEASEEVSEQRSTVIASTSSCEAVSSTVATTGYNDDDGGGADADDDREEHDDDDDDLEEDDMLARMAAAARGRRASLVSRSNPSTPQSSRRGLPMAQSASPAVPLPHTAQLEPLPAPPAEEGWELGWDSVEKRRVTRSQLAAEAKHSAKKAPAPSEAAGFGDAGEDEEDDDFFAGQYAAARDGSRRTSGKHSHSVRQTLEREYAIAAREHQRGGGTGRLER